MLPLTITNHLLTLAQIVVGVWVVILLVKAVKNQRLYQDYLFASKATLKLGMVGFILTQWGMILAPDLWAEMLIGMQVCLMAVMWALYEAFVAKYGELIIEYMDHTSILTFQSDKYTSIADGVMVRRYDWDNLAIIAQEESLIKIASQFNADGFVCLFFRIEDGASFPFHKHPGDEHTYLIEGKAIIIDDPEVIVTPDSPFVTPAETVHYFKAIGFCMGAAFVQKV